MWPTGPGSAELRAIMEASAEVLADFDDLAATHVWLWGKEAKKPVLKMGPATPLAAVPEPDQECKYFLLAAC